MINVDTPVDFFLYPRGVVRVGTGVLPFLPSLADVGGILIDMRNWAKLYC